MAHNRKRIHTVVPSTNTKLAFPYLTLWVLESQWNVPSLTVTSVPNKQNLAMTYVSLSLRRSLSIHSAQRWNMVRNYYSEHENWSIFFKLLKIEILFSTFLTMFYQMSIFWDFFYSNLIFLNSLKIVVLE